MTCKAQLMQNRWIILSLKGFADITFVDVSEIVEKQPLFCAIFV